MKQGNQSNNVQSVSTFDFKTLYTSIPHSKLKKVLADVAKTAFAFKKKEFISVVDKGAIFSTNRKAGFSLTVDELLECINFIIDQSYVMYKGTLYRQQIGIPMGTNCAPYLANLFLHAYEIAFIDKMSQNNNTLHIAAKLNHVYRYQDDCIVFNDNNT